MRLLLSLLPVVLTASCAQRMYFPEKAATFSFKEAGEAALSASVKLQSGESVMLAPGADVAYAITNHILAFAAYRTVNYRHIVEGEHDFSNRPDDYPFGGMFSGRRWEAGAGYFSDFGRLGIVEALAGYGRGTLSKTGRMHKDYDFETAYQRLMLQGAVGARFNDEAFQGVCSGGVRVAGQRFHRLISPNPDLRYEIAGRAGDILTDAPFWIEPFLNLEAGTRWIGFNAQTGATARLAGPSVSGKLPLYLTLGITLRKPLSGVNQNR